MYKCNIVDNSVLSISAQCRCDAKYSNFVFKDNWNAFQSQNTLIPLCEILTPLSIKKESKGELKNSYHLLNISDQPPEDGILNFKNIMLVDEINSDKTILSNSDLIVSKLGMPKGYIYLTPSEMTSLIGSTEFIPYSISIANLQHFIQYILLSKEMRRAYSCLETGKTPSHKRVNPEEFLKIKIPVISVGDACCLANQEIKGCVEKISKIQSTLENLPQKINEIFALEFEYDVDIANEFGKGISQPTQVLPEKGCKIFSANFSDLSRKSGLRLSTRFNNLQTQKLTSILSSVPTIKLSSVISEPVHRGKSPKYDTNGEIPVVKTAHLQNGKVNISTEEFVAADSYEKSPKAQVYTNDILMASTGKGSIGKVSIVKTSEKLFADSHITIVRFDTQKYNPVFALYFFQSILGYFQIERDYTGCTNQVDIYPESISDFLLPDISLDAQQLIVDKIHNEISKQNKAKKEIVKIRAEIDEIIKNTLLNDN